MSRLVYLYCQIYNSDIAKIQDDAIHIHTFENLEPGVQHQAQNHPEIRISGIRLRDSFFNNDLSDDLIRKLSDLKNCQLVKRKHSLYADQTNTTHAVIAISKQYQRAETFYWYAYHNDPQRKFLGEAEEGFMVFGMTDTDYGFAIPYSLLEQHWDELYSTTKKNGKEYKHIFIYQGRPVNTHMADDAHQVIEATTVDQ
jgi:hypothetical protein